MYELEVSELESGERMNFNGTQPRWDPAGWNPEAELSVTQLNGILRWVGPHWGLYKVSQG